MLVALAVTWRVVVLVRRARGVGRRLIGLL